jgi:serine/threonine-protein kinase
MEYVPGRTVRDLLDARGALPPREAAALILQLVEALTVAHAEGIIHRDVKPQNLLLDGTGTLKVLDFGIAVVQGRTGVVTEGGLVVGTPAYMAPEQLMGDTLTPAADLYAAGVVLYEALSGRLPYAVAAPMALVAQIVQHGPTPLHSAAPTVPNPLSDLVMHLLERDPAARPSAQAAAAALRAFA